VPCVESNRSKNSSQLPSHPIPVEPPPPAHQQAGEMQHHPAKRDLRRNSFMG
jgi:hypothetical protein